MRVFIVACSESVVLDPWYQIWKTVKYMECMVGVFNGVKRSQNFIWIGWDAFRLATACGDYGSTRVVRLGFHLMLIQQVTLDYVVVKGNLLHCIATLQRAGKSLKNWSQCSCRVVEEFGIWKRLLARRTSTSDRHTSIISWERHERSLVTMFCR